LDAMETIQFGPSMPPHSTKWKIWCHNVPRFSMSLRNMQQLINYPVAWYEIQQR
jgi:hypothetical protein